MDNYRFAIVLSCHAEALSVAADIEGMKALNTEREQRGHSLAYNEDAFVAKGDLLRGISNRILEVSRG